MAGLLEELKLTPVGRHFIAQARQRRPIVPQGVSEYVVQSYVRLRKEHKEQEEENKTHSYTSARTLLAVLRLAQALARLRFAETVETGDVDEALRLMEASKESLEERTEDGGDGDRTATSRIFRLMKGMATRPSGRRRMGRGPGGERNMDVDGDEDEEGGEMMQVAMVDLRARALAKGFTETQLMDTIQQVSAQSMRIANSTEFLFPVRVHQHHHSVGQRTVRAVCGCRRGLRIAVMYITFLDFCNWQWVACALDSLDTPLAGNHHHNYAINGTRCISHRARPGVDSETNAKDLRDPHLLCSSS